MHTFALYVDAQWHNISDTVAFIAVLTAAVSLGVIAAGLSEFGLSCRKTAMVVFVGSGFLAVCVVRPVAAPYLVGAFLATMIVLPLIMLLIGAALGLQDVPSPNEVPGEIRTRVEAYRQRRAQSCSNRSLSITDHASKE